MATERRFLAAALVLGLGLLAGCGNGERRPDDGHHASAPTAPGAGEIIQRHQQGASEAALLEFVNDPSRTFDLTDGDVADMVAAGVSTNVVDTALARSDAHHRARGHGGSDGHGHDHQH